MKTRVRFLFLVCAAAIAGVVTLQVAWLHNYYQLSRERFDKEVNLAFEDAVKKEFALRCDTIEGLLYRFLTDTSQIMISSRWMDKLQCYAYDITNRHNANDKATFSLAHFNEPVVNPVDSTAHYIARHFAQTLREEDLERHIIYYRTQNIGKYLGEKAGKFNFDTTRLRPVFSTLLSERNIFEPFQFYMRDEDSTLNRNLFPDSLQKSYPVITKAFPTYKYASGENYVRAMFGPPVQYLFSRMTGIIAGSLLLLLIVGFVLYYLVRIIQREKRLSAIKNDFISNITHELKTPVATVSTAIEALENFNALDNPARTKRYLTISKNELQRLTDMVNRILHTSLYEKGNFELKPETVNIDDMISEMTGIYTLQKDKPVSIQYSNETGTELVTADPLHLYNVISNLLDNAVKYSGDEAVIIIRFYRQQGYHVIDIRDNGMGIARRELPYIFDKFYRAPSGNLHRIKGYGLGLHYVKKIMEKHGGWCKVESRPGSGSTFTIGLTV